MSFDRPRLARVALSRLVEPGHREVSELVASVGPEAALRDVRSGRISTRLRNQVSARLEAGDPEAQAAADLERCARLGGRLVTPEDPEWPSALDDLVQICAPDDPHVYPPLCLWVRGPHDLGEVCNRAVAIVGTRAPTQYGTHMATELAYGLADRRWTVVSGGAYGIDAAAHRGALAAGGVTVVVLACGVDVAYPVGHVGLFDRVAEEGLLISEWPPGMRPQRHRFLVRNRVIAALAAGTVVVEAAQRSGAKATARRAAELDRTLMAVPGPATSALSTGPHQLIRELRAHLVTSVADVLDEVGRLGEALELSDVDDQDWLDGLGKETALVLDAMPLRRSVTVNAVAAGAGLSAGQVRRILPELQLRGLIGEDDSGYRLTDDGRARLTGSSRTRSRGAEGSPRSAAS